MKIYLDVCCLNRPFDDQGQARIRMESEAIAFIFGKIDAGEWSHVSSQAAEIEIAAMSDAERRRRVAALLPARRDRIRVTSAMLDRAEVLAGRGLRLVDALHVAPAEDCGADMMLTCDDRLLRAAKRLAGFLSVRVANPLQWIQEA